MASKTTKVMISSTVLDLPEYRAQVKQACNALEMVPKMMEDLPAVDKDGIAASLEMVDKADVYVGIFAHRYGSEADGDLRSITEMEYERAMERDMPRLIFVMDDDVPILRRNVQTGEEAERLARLKGRLLKERKVSFFTSPEDLRAKVLHSLFPYQHLPESGTPPPDQELSDRLESIRPSILDFHIQVDQGQYDEAFRVFRDRLFWPLLTGGCGREGLVLLQRLFPAGVGPDGPELQRPEDRSYALNALGLFRQAAGRPDRAIEPFSWAAAIDRQGCRFPNLVNDLRNWARSLLFCGRLKEAERRFVEAEHSITAESTESQKRRLLLDLFYAGAVRGDLDPAPLQTALTSSVGVGDRRSAEEAYAFRAERTIWQSLEQAREDLDPLGTEVQDLRQRAGGVRDLAGTAYELARGRPGGVLRVYRLRGQAALLGGTDEELSLAAKQLHSALEQMRESAWPEEEIPCQLTLAELRRRRGEIVSARGILDQVWQPIWSGRYRLFEADAFNLLARLERDAGHRVAAVAAASRAYLLARCDGPSYTYHWGLSAARRELAALDVPVLMRESEGAEG